MIPPEIARREIKKKQKPLYRRGYVYFAVENRIAFVEIRDRVAIAITRALIDTGTAHNGIDILLDLPKALHARDHIVHIRTEVDILAVAIECARTCQQTLAVPINEIHRSICRSDRCHFFAPEVHLAIGVIERHRSLPHTNAEEPICVHRVLVIATAAQRK